VPHHFNVLPTNSVFLSNMKNILNAVRKILPLLCIASFISLVGCERKSTPPGPSSSFGIVQPNHHFQFLLWDEGLVVLLVDNITKNHRSGGSSSTSDPAHRQRGSAISKEGYGYEWNLETVDGQSAEIEIAGNQYEFGKGVVFLIKVTEKETIVDQLDLDLSKLSDSQSCQDFIKANHEALRIGDHSAVKK